jgi:glycosyltransferase domain-containing protein
LIVATFNRASLLARLLGYLEREEAGFSILVLDSSAAETREQNARRIKESTLSIRHVCYPSDIDPFLKIGAGSRLVVTRYCSLCADDDLVVVPAVRRCIGVLERRPRASSAHGWYFNFSDAKTFDLSYVVYRGASLGDGNPLVRLRKMFASYEAVFYAVYRTPVLQAVFARVADLRTVLGRELLGAALAALSGRIIRIPDFYYGRSTGESVAYERWHPHQIMAESPEMLFQEYEAFRGIVLESLPIELSGRNRESLRSIVDLIFLRYLGQFLRPDVIDLMIDDRSKGVEPRAVVEHVWDVFVRCSARAVHPLAPLIDPEGGFSPKRLREGDQPRDYIAQSKTAAGAARTYRIFHEFLFPAEKPPAIVGKRKLLTLLARVDAY